MFAASPRRSSIDQGLVTADIAAKSLRKAQIRDAGADNIVLVLQDRLDTKTIAASAQSRWFLCLYERDQSWARP
jgi:hypothetical protein